MRRLKLFFSWLYTLDHYWERDNYADRWRRPSLWDYLYKKRIGIKRAWWIANDICKTFKTK